MVHLQIVKDLPMTAALCPASTAIAPTMKFNSLHLRTSPARQLGSLPAPAYCLLTDTTSIKSDHINLSRSRKKWLDNYDVVCLVSSHLVGTFTLDVCGRSVTSSLAARPELWYLQFAPCGTMAAHQQQHSTTSSCSSSGQPAYLEGIYVSSARSITLTH